MKAKYYFYSNQNVGERYFKVKEGRPVLMIVDKIQAKKGRPNCIGVTYITYLTFISSWGWKLSDSRYIKETPKKHFDKVLGKMINKFHKENPHTMKHVINKEKTTNKNKS